jgi:hypothetical protein
MGEAVARMERGQVNTRFGWETLRERDYLEDLGVDGRTILRSIFKKRDGACTELILL